MYQFKKLVNQSSFRYHMKKTENNKFEKLYKISVIKKTKKISISFSFNIKEQTI
jgi:hypothetical protein